MEGNSPEVNSDAVHCLAENLGSDTSSISRDTVVEREYQPAIEISAEDQQRVVCLARSLTAPSTDGIDQSLPQNPFACSTDATLDPNSSQFDVKRWITTFFHSVSQDPRRYPLRSAGISVRDLSVHGYGSSVAYQKDFLNVLLQAVDMVAGYLNRKEQKIQILKDHDALLRSGEMLLVLGRPGR